jgi:hypothetical protein
MPHLWLLQEAANVVSHAREREHKALLRNQRRLRRLKEIATEVTTA